MLALVAGSLIATAVAVSWAQDAGQSLIIEQPVSDDIYAANQDIKVWSTIDGDLVAAGQRISVDGEITGDAILAAQYIEIRGSVGDDVRASGQQVQVFGPVAGHIVAAAQSITIDGDVGGWAWLAGSNVTVRGKVEGDLKVFAQTVEINSEVTGSVEATGGALRLGPSADVRGEVRWRSDNEAEINPDAQIDGELIEEPLPDYMDEAESGSKVISDLGRIIAVAALLLLFPRPLKTSAERIAARPGISLVLGFVVLVSLPLLALILLISGIGASLGLVLLGTYLAMLFAGLLIGLFSVSDLALRRIVRGPAMWQALAAIVATVIVLRLLSYIPYVGGLAFFAIWLLGVGSISWLSWRALKGPGEASMQET